MRFSSIFVGRSLSTNALGLGQLIAWGALYYAIPLLGAAIEDDIGWGKQQLYAGVSLGLVVGAVLAFPLGSLIDKGHGRVLMSGAGVVGAILLWAWAGISHLWQLYVVLAAIGAVQACLLYEAAFAAVAFSFPVRAREAMISITIWGGLASTIMFPIGDMIVRAWGWRPALWIFGGLLMICGLLNWFGLRSPTQNTDHPERKRPLNVSSDKQQIPLSPAFLLLTCSFTLHSALFAAFALHLYPFLVEAKAPQWAIITAIAAIGPSQVLARIVMHKAKVSSAIASGALALGGIGSSLLVLAAMPSSAWIVIGATIIFGAANGVFSITRAFASMELLSDRNYGAINGAINAPGMLARAASPVALAIVWTMTRSYHLPMIILAAAAGLAALLFMAAVNRAKAK